MPHPCLECGACCATWAVQFDRREVRRALKRHVVPAATSAHVLMRGTDTEPPRCAALTGRVGGRASCSIYAIRPSPCREVLPSMADGRRDVTCDEARARHGLSRLTLADWRV